MPSRIFITGPAASGKDRARHALMVARVCNQDPRCSGILHIIAARMGVKPDRSQLQALGDALRSIYGDDALARYADHTAAKRASWDDDARFVVADVRLPAEGKYLRSRGWIGIRIQRDEASRQAELVRRGEDPATMEHHTEKAFLDVPVDAVIPNDCNPEEFDRRVVQTVQRLILEHDPESQSWLNMRPEGREFGSGNE